MQPSTPSELHQRAVYYASKGLHIFPCWPGTKKPIPKTGFKEATTDLGQINAWWSANPNANIAIALSASGLFCFDVDCKNPAKDGRPIEAELLRLGHLTPTLNALTPSGGRHYVYSLPQDFDRKKAARAVLKGVDLLLPGYILAAPSVVNGGYYAWMLDAASHQPHPVTPLPQAIGDLYHGKLPPDVTFGFDNPQVSKDAAGNEVVLKASEGELEILEGGRNNALYAEAAKLRKAGASENQIWHFLKGMNSDATPPIDLTELRYIFGNVLKVHDDTAYFKQFDIFATALKNPEGGDDDLLAQFTMTPERLVSRKHMSTLITGWLGLDATCAFTRGGIAVIAAPPGAGKTMFVLQLSRQLIELGESVVFWSLELSREAIESRILSRHFGVPFLDIATRPLTPEMIADFEANHGGLGTHLAIVGCKDPFRETAEAFRRKHGKPPVVIVDYGQLLPNTTDTEIRAFSDERVRLNGMLTSFKKYVEDNDMAAFVLAATNRASNKQTRFVEPEEPEYADYIAASKDTSYFEYVAENFVFLETESVKVKDAEGRACNRVRGVVAKARYGEMSVSYFLRYGALGRFVEVPENTFYDLGAHLPPPAQRKSAKPPAIAAPAATALRDAYTLPASQETGLPRVKLQPTAELLWSLVVRSHMRQALPDYRDIAVKFGGVVRQLLNKGYITMLNGTACPGPALPDYKEDHAACVEAIKTKLQKQFAMVFSFV